MANEPENPPPGSQQNWRPIPDPTLLTTEAVEQATSQYRRELTQLRELLEAQLHALGYRQNIAEQTAAKAVADLKTLLDERYAGQTRRFEDSRAAAVKAVEAALSSAQQAVNKAETASDKRFDAVNEFRQQLADQTRQFITRAEYGTSQTALTDSVTLNRSRLDTITSLIVPRNETDAWRDGLTTKIDDGLRTLTERIATLELRLTSRLDVSSGQTSGQESQRTEQRLSQGAIVSLVVGVLILLGLIVSTITLVVH